MSLKKLKEKLQKKRSSKNFLWRNLFFIRDTLEQLQSNILDLLVMVFKKPKNLKIQEISSKLFENNIGKYFYFGEFGYFQFSVLGGLSQYFKRYPHHKIEIVTYEDYGKILELAFPENVKAYYVDYKFNEIYRQCHDYNDRIFRVTIKKKGFNKNVAKKLIFITPRLSKIQFDDISDESFFNMIRPLKYPLKKKKEKFVSIFPRFRKTSIDRNINEDMWNQIIKLLLKLSYKVIVLGLSSESLKLKHKNLIYPKNIYEQISYLNNSILYISPFSGFQHFAENCGCDIFILLRNDQTHINLFEKHKKFNPFGAKIYSVKENENYLGKLQKVLRRLERGNSNGKSRKRN